MKFLTNPNNLQLHFDTLVRSITISQEIIKFQAAEAFLKKMVAGSASDKLYS
jgi:hypothetical protein